MIGWFPPANQQVEHGWLLNAILSPMFILAAIILASQEKMQIQNRRANHPATATH
jgi:hypothetical protein